MVYSLYALGAFERDHKDIKDVRNFVKDFMYPKLKAKSKEPDTPAVMTTLIQEQIATFNLMYKPIQRRNYAHSLLKVGILYSDNKLQLNSFHCFKTI